MRCLIIALSLLLIIPSTHAISGGEVYDLLVITHPEFISELQDFVEFKETRGIRTKLVSIEDIYDGVYFECRGRDDAEKIKYFIKDAYDNWHIRYVLLVGSAKMIPVRYVYLNDFSSTWEYERRFISDLYYADIYDENGNFSSWDTNNNGFFGEYRHEIGDKKYSDDTYPEPEIAIGRLACRNKIELRNAINKIMNYHGDSRLLLIGGDSYPNDPCGDISEGIYLEEAIAEKMQGWNISRLYPPKNFRQISSYINNGAGIVVMEGAGGQHIWATHEHDSEKWIYYFSWNIRMLRNDIYPVVVTSGARLAKFDEKRECFNWVFVASRHGAVASIGSTGLCWTAHGKNVTEFYLGNLHLRFFAEYRNATYLGDAWKNAIISYLRSFHRDGVVEKAFHLKAAEELELFGDPTLQIYHVTSCDVKNSKRYLYVGGAGEGNYSDIQSAVDDASPGDEIIVLSGVYNENVTIWKSLTISGYGATLKGHFDISAPSTIKSFRIEGSSYCISCESENVTLKDNTIVGYYGILMNNSEYSTISDNSFKCIYAVVMENSNHVKIRNNSIRNNWYGIWSEGCRFLDVEKNNFSFNRWYTLWLERSDNSLIRCNTFYMNWYSIFLYHSDGCTIEKNIIVHNEHGPQIDFSSNNILRMNDIRYNEHYGVYVDNASAGNRIEKNNIVDNAHNARDDGKNIWYNNYWSDYIGLKYRILGILRIPKHISKFNFDWCPATKEFDVMGCQSTL